ncbi:hypothetical protein [Ralstonia phage RSK1]|uniref:Uncharacterized protein n=1 Tax=Ralstonia phage RSK1 TaxID=1417599 RepID=U6C720_9CAUD|nr:hypothetical protein X532_gp53 [Ralstonia phage RSK1]BAO04718.1 hypothetical protein [Ralstonia phage RSK1]
MSEEQTNQTSIVGEIVSEFQKLEEKVEHLIHPDAAAQLQEAGMSAVGPFDATAPAIEAAAASGTFPNVIPAISDLAPMQSTTEQIAQIQAIGDAPVPMNASVSDVVAQSENGMQSSVRAASPNDGTLAASGFADDVAARALASIQRIREHLWTFERSAVAHLHAELDKLESIFAK